MIGNLRNNIGQWFDQLVIGSGSSALNFLHSAREGSNQQFKSENTLVIGKSDSDLWSRTDRVHAMGQPPQLLQRRLGNEQYPILGEKPRPTGLNEQSREGTKKGEYVTAGSYTDHLGKMRRNLSGRGINFVNAIVKSGGVTVSGDGFKVEDQSGNCYYGKNVIVASGIGPAKTLDNPDVNVKLSQDLSQLQRLGYDEIVDAVTYYNSSQPKGLRVLVYGGSATASWAACHACKMQAKELLWLCRKGIDQISTEGNPVGRNSEIIQWAVKNDRIRAGEITAIEPNLGAKPGEPRLKVFMTFYKMVRKDPKKPNTVTLTHTRDNRYDGQGFYEFHQVVYAVGSDPMGRGGPGNILAANIRDQLVPVYAKNYQFMTGDNDILLAYRNPKQNLWVVGAAVFGGLGVKKLADLKAKYSRVGEYLPQAGTPPEGIAILSTTIDALTGRMEADPAKFDWNRARPEEIANLFKTLFKQLNDKQAAMIAKELVRIRSDCKFVLPHDAIRKFVADFNEVYVAKMNVKLLQLRPAT
jgi:hypothetical protein